MISIGKFSRTCQVSVKTLRLYDRLGLLKPAYIDETTSYRYYETDQLDTMIVIQRYKRFGFSLDEIKTMLDDLPADNTQKLILKLADLLRQKQELENTISDLQILIGHTERNSNMDKTVFENYMIDVIEHEPMPIYGLRREMGVGDYGIAFSELFEQLGEKGVQNIQLTGARYFDPDFDANASDIQIFAQVGKADANDTIEGGCVVHTVHKGAYSGLNEAYAAVVKWMETHDYEQTGAPYELYTKCGINQYPIRQWETDIYFPAKKK
ncbi:MerR family transcriptional regulator [uncultured Dubosiella sp.]|uniref:MerR family transcriptional regulator n=1 Tax=uncultured Dubosiella sp. TaxID=1937011 RepID=UPI002083ED43|nr:MerR family transcriptional regulator [uncultured Dubosiella sp.]GJM58256.1 MerR family transcriptional regulator [Erysipelotrichaceae bacterium OPF54]